MEKVVIVGAGNLGKSVLDIIFKRRYMLLEDIQVVGFLDEDTTIHGQLINGVKVLGTVEAFLNTTLDDNLQFIVAIENSSVKKDVVKKIEDKGFINFYTAIHPRAIIANNVRVGVGTIIHSGAIINTETDFGEHVIVGAGSIIEIGSKIEDYVVLKAKVILGEGVFIGQCTQLNLGTIVRDYEKVPPNYQSKVGHVL